MLHCHFYVINYSIISDILAVFFLHLMNIFSRFWRWLLGLFWTKELTITIVGLPNAGKSTLVRAIANENTEEATVPTIGANVSSVTVGNVVFKIHDIDRKSVV